MKKTLVLLSLVFVLVGCGQSNNLVDTQPISQVEVGVDQQTTLTSITKDVEKDAKDIQADARISAVNMEDSVIEWRGGKIIGGDHWGTLLFSSVELDMVDNVITAGKVVVDMNSMTVTDLEGVGAKKLIEHFMNDDFFAVEVHPEAVLEFSDVTYASDTTATVTGALTIKNITKPVTFNFVVEENVFVAELVLDRTEWGIRYGSGKFFDDLGDKAIKDEMELNIKIIMN